MKTCSICGKTKPLDDFYFDINRASGYGSRCKLCDAARVLARYHITRAKAIAIYGGACLECGSDEGLEFDHPDWDGGEHRKTEPHDAMLRRIVREGGPLTDRHLRLLCPPHHRACQLGRLHPALDKARKWQRELTTMSRTEAAAAIGVAPRTVQRWRQALRLEGVTIPDRNHPWTRSASS